MGQKSNAKILNNEITFNFKFYKNKIEIAFLLKANRKFKVKNIWWKIDAGHRIFDAKTAKEKEATRLHLTT